MITRAKHRRTFLLILLITVIAAASSYCFELEPSASEESRHGAQLLESELFDSAEEIYPASPIYEAEAEPVFCECFAKTEEVEASREPLLSGSLAIARAINRELSSETTAMTKLKEADPAMETAAIMMIQESEDHEIEDEWSEWEEGSDDEWTDELYIEAYEESYGESSEESFDESFEEFLAGSFDALVPESHEEMVEAAAEEGSEESSEVPEEIFEGSDEVSAGPVETAQGSQEASPAPFDYSVYSDLDLLAAICQIEAGYHYEGALAVANVVLNRLHSGFADSIYGVIFAPYQFATGDMEYYLTHGTSDSARTAAQDALNGVNNVGSFLNFNGRYWLDPATLDVPYVEIGGNVFY